MTITKFKKAVEDFELLDELRLLCIGVGKYKKEHALCIRVFT